MTVRLIKPLLVSVKFFVHDCEILLCVNGIIWMQGGLCIPLVHVAVVGAQCSDIVDVRADRTHDESVHTA